MGEGQAMSTSALKGFLSTLLLSTQVSWQIEVDNARSGETAGGWQFKRKHTEKAFSSRWSDTCSNTSTPHSPLALVPRRTYVSAAAESGGSSEPVSLSVYLLRQQNLQTQQLVQESWQSVDAVDLLSDVDDLLPDVSTLCVARSVPQIKKVSSVTPHSPSALVPRRTSVSAAAESSGSSDPVSLSIYLLRRQNLQNQQLVRRCSQSVDTGNVLPDVCTLPVARTVPQIKKVSSVDDSTSDQHDTDLDPGTTESGEFAYDSESSDAESGFGYDSESSDAESGYGYDSESSDELMEDALGAGLLGSSTTSSKADIDLSNLLIQTIIRLSVKAAVRLSRRTTAGTCMVEYHHGSDTKNYGNVAI